MQHRYRKDKHTKATDATAWLERSRRKKGGVEVLEDLTSLAREGMVEEEEKSHGRHEDDEDTPKLFSLKSSRSI